MIYFRPHDGRSLRCNVNARRLNVLVVPLFPLWIIGAFCVKDSKWLFLVVLVFKRDQDFLLPGYHSWSFLGEERQG